MADIARTFRLDNQPPLIQLVFSFCFVIAAGTILFWLFIIAGSFIFGLPIGKMTGIPQPGPDDPGRFILKYVQFSQQTGLFLIPALLAARFIRKDDESFLKTGRMPRPLPALIVISLAFVLIPVINYTGALNSRMVLPDFLSGVQEWMRAEENKASSLTELLITSSGLLTLSLNIFILAVVPALSEELLFRGLFQQLFCRLFRSSHAAIWLTAIIFSSVHFQFYGFIPRLILGLIFGYLFYWSANIWFPVIAHFVNNVIPVTVIYFGGMKDSVSRLSPGGEESTGFPFVGVILSALLLFYCWKEFSRFSASSGRHTEGNNSAGA